MTSSSLRDIKKGALKKAFLSDGPSSGSEAFSLIISFEATRFELPGIKSLYSCGDDLAKNLGKRMKKVHFRLTCVAQKRLSSAREEFSTV